MANRTVRSYSLDLLMVRMKTTTVVDQGAGKMSGST
jgi:hypothetical protein